jgi:fatty-acyl-CoA synthase
VEVEPAIAEHPAVMEVAVGVPDERSGEVPAAYVTLRDGAEATADQIMDHVRARPAWCKVPKTVEFAELPKMSSGKIQKHVLRENAWSGRQSRIH